jgi:GNAT superfamily N-acetyltransferase
MHYKKFMELDPRHYQVDVILRDGGMVHIRAIRSDDKQRLLDGFHQLSDRSISFRFLRPKRELTKKELSYFTEIDFIHHVALVATLPDNEDKPIIGVGRYIVLDTPLGAQRAEVAFTVVDEHQGRGIATLLLEHLVLIARDRGISTFEANVLVENHPMLEVFEQSGFQVRQSVIEPGVVRVSFSIGGEHHDIR